MAAVKDFWWIYVESGIETPIFTQNTELFTGRLNTASVWSERQALQSESDTSELKIVVPFISISPYSLYISLFQRGKKTYQAWHKMPRTSPCLNMLLPQSVILRSHHGDVHADHAVFDLVHALPLV